MNLLLVSETFPPEIRAISYMMYEFAIFLAQRGHNVTVLTTKHFSDNSKAEFEDVCRNLDQLEIKVIRVKSLVESKGNYVLRGINEMMLPLTYYFSVPRSIRKNVGLVIGYTPPLTLGIVGILFKRLHRAKYLLNVQDIFPQNAIDLRILRNGLAISFYQYMESFVYKFADQITCHTPNSKRFLIDRKSVDESKVSVIPNWIDFNDVPKSISLQNYRKKFNLVGNFVVFFGGNLGPSQNLSYIIKLAQATQDLSDVCFVFMGDGPYKKKLELMAMELEVRNVKFLDVLDRSEYHLFLQEMDIGLVSLSMLNTTPVYPGKLLGYMANAIPVLAYLHNESDGHDIIKDSGCGFSQVAGDLEESVRLFRYVYDHKDMLPKMGKMGYDYAKKYFSQDDCLGTMNDIIGTMK